MKNIGKLAVLGAVLTASASFAFADTIDLVSSATAVTAPGGASINTAVKYQGANLQTFVIPNPVAQPDQTPIGFVGGTPAAGSSTANLTPGSTWLAALAAPVQSSWVGATSNFGPGGPNVPQGFYTYTTTFSANGGTYNGSIGIMSDDTVETILDYGTADQMILNGFGAIGADSHCSVGTPNCSVSTFTDTLSGVSLLAGTNTLTFIVEQAGDESQPNQDPSGLDFSGQISQTPEPSSLLLMGTGLVGAAGLLFRRRLVA